MNSFEGSTQIVRKTMGRPLHGEDLCTEELDILFADADEGKLLDTIVAQFLDEETWEGTGPDIRVRLPNGLELGFPNFDALQRFMGGTGSAEHRYTTDGGLHWYPSWALDQPSVHQTQTQLPRRPRRRGVPTWFIIASIVLAMAWVASTFRMPANMATSLQPSEDSWMTRYDRAMTETTHTARPPLQVPEADAPAPIPPEPLFNANREMLRHPSTAADHALVGQYAAQNGAWEEATTAYRRALKLDPNNRKYQRKLGIYTDMLMSTTQAIGD